MEEDVTLESNTGAGKTSNDAGVGSILSGLQNAVTTGASIYKTVTGTGSTPAPQAAAAPAAPVASSSSWQKYLPYGIGALVLIIVAGFFLKRGR